MDKIISLMSSGSNAILIVGTSLVILACMWKALPSLMDGDAKGAVRTVVGFIVAYIVFVLIPTLFFAIKAALS